MQGSEISVPLPKIAKPDFGFYGLLLSLALTSTLTLFSDILEPALHKYLGYALVAIFSITHINLIIGLSFEAFRRYSRFGISHTKKILNHILSIILAVLPFAALVIPFLIVPAFILMAVSEYKSPDEAEQSRLAFYQKGGFFYIVKTIMWIPTGLFLL